MKDLKVDYWLSFVMPGGASRSKSEPIDTRVIEDINEIDNAIELARQIFLEEDPHLALSKDVKNYIRDVAKEVHARLGYVQIELIEIIIQQS